MENIAETPGGVIGWGCAGKTPATKSVTHAKSWTVKQYVGHLAQSLARRCRSHRTYATSVQAEESARWIGFISATDVTEKLLSLKKLLDEGLITQEEFDAKKKELLGF